MRKKGETNLQDVVSDLSCDQSCDVNDVCVNHLFAKVVSISHFMHKLLLFPHFSVFFDNKMPQKLPRPLKAFSRLLFCFIQTVISIPLLFLYTGTSVVAQ